MKYKKPINKYKFYRACQKKGNSICQAYICRNFDEMKAEMAFSAVKQGDFIYLHLKDGTFWRYYVGPDHYAYDALAYYELFKVW